ncbi:LarC family nickel insertion protein [Nitratidesulfovibrio vulgaris]|uniref:LarC family nickel insertion protein n=1 Tax=Nitratidesulfovibrio vulgaris TaxID=881 RepID=UPI002300D572|nr:LarC family nickel insertion protein [Nitratidesulfovibrio vulgaris]WCB47323.1 LarC family nickel insertion protein [Nitratidesulfovibrio vulgaris]
MRLFMDCRAGIAGDMVLAAFAGLGVDMQPLQALFVAAGVDCRIRAIPVTRHGLTGHTLSVEWDDPQPLRTLPDMAAVLDGLACTGTVRQRAWRAFTRLAEVEAAVHGVRPEDVHFHEVGAIDTLVDVVGAFWALERLGVDEVVCSALPWFSGVVVCAHGTLPLPAPAVVRLLEGVPVFPTAAREELVTPTGALVATALADRFDEGPSGIVRASATGYGSRPSGGGLRLFLHEAAPRALSGQGRHGTGHGNPTAGDVTTTGAAQKGYRVETVVQLETHLDHLTGEELGRCFDVLPQAGALDVLWLPGVMKKNRPGGVLRVLCEPRARSGVEAAIFEHTHTLGIRRQLLERVVAAREASLVEVGDEDVPAKGYEVDGVTFSRPEYDALCDLSRRTGRSLPALRMMLWGERGPTMTDSGLPQDAGDAEEDEVDTAPGNVQPVR